MFVSALNFQQFVTIYTSIAVLLFFAITLIVPGGYVYGPLMLVLGGCLFVWFGEALQISKQDWILIGVLLLYFLLNIVSNLFHRLPLNAYDQTSRFLFAIPALLLLLKHPPKINYLWIGVAIGGAGAGLWSIWGKFFVVLPMGYTWYDHMNSIQYGDISVLYCLLSTIGILWSFTEHKSYFWLAMFFCALVLSVIALLLSGARGALLCFPLLYYSIYFCYSQIFKKNNWAVILVVCIVFVGATYLIPQSGFKIRIDAGFKEVASYESGDSMDSSTGVRINLWKIGGQAFIEHPIMGWGTLEKIKINNPDRWKSFNKAEVPLNHFHNEYVDAAAKRGIVGLAALILLYLVPLVLFAVNLHAANQSKRIFSFAGVMVISCSMIFGLTQTFMAHNSGTIVYLFVLLIIWSGLRSSDCSPNQKANASYV